MSTMAMSVNAWKALSLFLTLLVFFQFYLIISHQRGLPYRPSAQPPQVITSPSTPAPGKWRFDTERDANNPALTAEQCDAAFPDLYHEIDRSVKFWKDKKHTISPEDVDIRWRRDAALRVLIYDNQLRILRAKNTWSGAYFKRAMPVLSQLHRALLGASAAGEKMPNIEFAVTVDDMSLMPGEKDDTHTVWAFTRNQDDRIHDREWVMPDFNYWANGQRDSFYDMELRAKANDAPIADKIQKAVWRGVRWTNEPVRGSLLDKTEGKEWADIVEMNWDDEANFMRMEDLCRYAYVVHTEGRSWSGRLKFLWNCNSVPIIHDLRWIAHSYHLLIPDGPDQNYLPVKRDFSDLEEKITHLLAHPDEAQRIADNAVKTFRARYTTMAAESCYWRHMIKGYSDVSFTPEPFENRTVEVGLEKIVEEGVRGKTYEGMTISLEEHVQEWMKSLDEGE